MIFRLGAVNSLEIYVMVKRLSLREFVVPNLIIIKFQWRIFENGVKTNLLIRNKRTNLCVVM